MPWYIIMILVSTSLIMSILVLMIFMLFKVLPDTISAKSRYIIWIIVLLGLIIPFRPILGTGLITLESPFEENEIIDYTREFGTIDLTESISKHSSADSLNNIDTPDNDISILSENSEVKYKTNVEPGKNVEQNKSQRAIYIVSVLILVWFVGMIFMASRHIIKYRRFKQTVNRWKVPVKEPEALQIYDFVKKSMGLSHKQIQLFRCSSISSPMLIGLFKPSILLPNIPMDDDELEVIIRHELTHYKHHDLFINLLIMIATSVYWFNPIVYMCCMAIQLEGEVCCDETVLYGKDADYRRFYGEIIISMIEKNNKNQTTLSTCFYSKKLNMKRRIISIMNTNKIKKISMLSITAVLTVTIISGSVLAFSSVNKQIRNLGVRKAKEIALKDAGLKSSEVKFIKAKLDNEDGTLVYDVEFYKDNKEYDYEIDAKSGKILSVDFDIENYEILNNQINSGVQRLIGDVKAKEIALNHAGLKESEVEFIKAKTDTEDGQLVYDVEFFKGNKEYDYEIDAVNGHILSVDYDIENYVPKKNKSNNSKANQNTQGLIGDAKAKEIALKDAGLNANQVVFVKSKLDFDDGVQVYDIEFYSGNVEYDYEIDAKTGRILEKDLDIENYTIPVPKTNNQSPNNQGLISEAKAKEIALRDAGLNANQVTFVKAKLDKDDGIWEYDVEFYAGNTKYEYEINANNGNITSRDIDHDDRDDD